MTASSFTSISNQMFSVVAKFRRTFLTSGAGKRPENQKTRVDHTKILLKNIDKHLWI